MSNINLSQPSKQDPAKLAKRTFIDRGVLISFIILLATGVSFGGVKLYKINLNSEIESIKKQIKNEKNKLKQEDLARIFDVHERVSQADENINAKMNLNFPLNRMEELLIKDVYFTYYQYDTLKNNINASLVTNGFDTMAKQIANFKKGDPVENVVIQNILKQKEETIIFDLEIFLKEKSNIVN